MLNTILNTYGANTVATIKSLSDIEKIVLGLCFMQMQEPLVKSFDLLYNEKLLPIYLSCIEEGVDAIFKESSQLQQMINVAEKSIPDSDDYPSVEGVYAQNALIGAYYLFNFILNKNDDDILASLEKYFESVDVIGYELNCDEDLMFCKEVKIVEDIIASIKQVYPLDKSGISKLLSVSRMLKRSMKNWEQV